MTDNGQLQSSPLPVASVNEEAVLNSLWAWVARNSAVIAIVGTVVPSIIGATWYIASLIDEVRTETKNELEDRSSAIIEMVNDNKSELIALTERVTHIQDDVKDIQDKIDAIQEGSLSKAIYAQ